VDVATELRTYLKTKSAITAIVGSGTAARIYLFDAPQDRDLPYVVIEVTSGSAETHLTGSSGIAQNRVTVICYGATETAAYALNEAVRVAPLLGYRGTMGSGTVRDVGDGGGYESGYDPPTTGGNQKRYWTMQHYTITHIQTTT